MARFIIPPQEGAADKTIFLAGPVQGTHDRQREAADRLIDALPEPDIDIVSPRGLAELYASRRYGLKPSSKHHGKSAILFVLGKMVALQCGSRHKKLRPQGEHLRRQVVLSWDVSRGG